MVGQVEKHRQVPQHDVLGAPPLGLGTQDQVLERRNGQCVQAGVDALRVGLEQFTLRRSGPVHDGASQRAQTVNAPLPVKIGCIRTEEFPKLSRRGAPQEVHLKKAILTVDEAGRAGDVSPAAAPDGRYAVAIAFDGHRPRQACHANFAVQHRQAAGSEPMQHNRSRSEDQRHQGQA